MDSAHLSVRALLLSRPSHVVNVPRDYTGIQSPTSTRRPASRDERPTSEFRHLRFPSSLGDQKPAKLSSRELPRDFGEDKFGFPEWLLSRDRATFARLLSVPQFRSKDTQASHTRLASHLTVLLQSTPASLSFCSFQLGGDVFSRS